MLQLIVTVKKKVPFCDFFRKRDQKNQAIGKYHMKKISKYLLLAAIVFVLFAAGCVKKDVAIQATPATPAPTGEPTPTPTPSPTPLPYDLVAEGVQADYRFASGYPEVADALWAIRDNTADNALTELFSQDEASSAEMASLRMQSGQESADRIVFDNGYIYAIDGKDLIVVRAAGADAELVTRTTVGVDWTGEEDAESQAISGWEKTPLAVLPMGNALAVIGDCYGYNGFSTDLTYTEYTSVDIYSLADPTAPVLLSGYGQDGVYSAAGIHNDTFYVLSSFEVFRDIDPNAPESFIPRLYEGEYAAAMAPESCLIAPNGGFSGFSVVGTYDISGARTGALALLGLGPDTYEADGKLFFTTNRWADSPSRTLVENGYNVAETAVAECSEIFRFTVDGPVALQNACVVDGAIDSSAALDLENGELRYAARLRQGLYTGDAAQPFWRDRENGARIAVLNEDLQLLDAADQISTEDNVSWIGFLETQAVMTSAGGESRIYSIPGNGTISYTGNAPSSVWAKAVLPWGERGYMAFYLADDGKLTLSVRDRELRELASRTFGSDHSNTLESRECYVSDEEINVFGFSADDSYCIYGLDENSALVFRKDVFLNDWAWNARCFRAGERLYIADTRELFVLDAATLEDLQDFSF